MKALLYLSGEVGQKIGRKVAAEQAAAEAKLMSGWGHAEKIAELKGDSGLSVSYVRDLIESSGKPVDLQSISEYVADRARSSNMDEHTRDALWRSCRTKIEQIQDNEALRELLRQHRENAPVQAIKRAEELGLSDIVGGKGPVGLSELADWLGHLV